MVSFKQFLLEEKLVLPPKPGTVPVPPGHIRLYHQTDLKNVDSISKHGIQFSYARGIEGPKSIYADERGFYGEPGKVPTIEFHVPKENWYPPFVTVDVPTKNIIAIHLPWHAHARYIENNPEVKRAVLAGEHDDLLTDSRYGQAIRYIKQTYGGNA